MAQAAILVENISKRYRLGLKEREPQTLRESVLSTLASPFSYVRKMARPMNEEETLWALRDVSFQVGYGEVVGLIGRNGAGKSTLLKILSRITDPTDGRAIINGRVGSLLEVGTGFHPELTGRENVYMSGTILGMKKYEIDRKMEEIVEFAEIGRFLDTPVKRYSSGMSVRLGFSVAAHLEPEILIVDEVLAVGDTGFQKKCMGKMSSISGQGRTILFVSHNMPSIQALCSRAVWLRDGKVIMTDQTAAVITEYLGAMLEPTQALVDLTDHPKRITPAETAVFKEIALRNEAGKLATQFQVGDKITFELLLDVGRQSFQDPVISIIVERRATVITTLGTLFMVKDSFRIANRTLVKCTWETANLMPGSYSVQRLVFKKYRNSPRLDTIEGAIAFDILPRDVFGTGKLGPEDGVLLPRGEWEFQPDAAG